MQSSAFESAFKWGSDQTRVVKIGIHFGVTLEGKWFKYLSPFRANGDSAALGFEIGISIDTRKRPIVDLACWDIAFYLALDADLQTLNNFENELKTFELADAAIKVTDAAIDIAVSFASGHPTPAPGQNLVFKFPVPLYTPQPLWSVLQVPGFRGFLFWNEFAVTLSTAQPWYCYLAWLYQAHELGVGETMVRHVACHALPGNTQLAFASHSRRP